MDVDKVGIAIADDRVKLSDHSDPNTDFVALNFRSKLEAIDWEKTEYEADEFLPDIRLNPL